MMRALELQWLVKRHISGRSDVEQWRNQAHSFSGCQVTLAWRHQIVSQSDSQIVSQQKNLLNKKFIKFHSKLMQMLRVDLKTFLGLAIPNQIPCCQKVNIWQIFRWNFWVRNTKPYWSLYIVLPYYMMIMPIDFYFQVIIVLIFLHVMFYSTT